MSSRPFDVYIKTMTGKTIMLMVSSSDTVMQLKKKIQDKEGVGTSEQRILYSGKQLEDERTIGDYGIPKESTLFLIVRLNEANSTPKASPQKTDVPKKKVPPQPPAQMDVYWLAPESLSKQYFVQVQQAFVTTVRVFVSPLKPVYRFLLYLWKTIFYPPLKLFWDVLSKVSGWIHRVVLTRLFKVIKFVFNTTYNFLRPLVLTIKSVIRDSFKGLYKLLKYLFNTIDKVLVQPLWKLTKAIWKGVGLPLCKGINRVAIKTTDALNKTFTKSADAIVWLYDHSLHHIFKGLKHIAIKTLDGLEWSIKKMMDAIVWMYNHSLHYVFKGLKHATFKTLDGMEWFGQKTIDATVWLYKHSLQYVFKGISTFGSDYLWPSIKYVGRSIDKFSTWLDLDGKAVSLFNFIGRVISNSSSWLYRNLLKPVLVDPANWLARKTGSACSWTLTQVKKAIVWSSKQTYNYVLLPTWRVFKKGVLLVWDYTLHPVFTLLDKIYVNYIYAWLFQPTTRIIIKYYTVMYEKVKKWFVWGLETNGFVVGVSPGTTLATRANDMIVAMPHNTTYSIRVYNGQPHPVYCKITIDEQIDVGMFWLNAKYAFKIERCASSTFKFLFVKDPQQTSDSISQSKIDSNLDEVFVQLKERNKGVITIKWLVPNGYGVVPQAQSVTRAKSMNSAPSSLDSRSDNNNNNNAEEAKEDEAEGGTAFGFGSTVLSGSSNQQMQKLQHHYANMQESTTQTIYLVAPLGGKEKTD